MATSALGDEAKIDVSGAKDRTWEVVRAAFLPLASLKLTVALLSLAVIQVLLGTLAQDKLDMWEVMSEYFRAWFTWVELRVLFPELWWAQFRMWLPEGWLPAQPVFPNIPMPGGGSLPMGFPFPGGFLIGTLLAVNLFSAHLLRFKVQAKGRRLSFGVAAIVVGVVVTMWIISSGHNSGGLQGEPDFSMRTFWLATNLVFFLTAVGSAAWLFRLIPGVPITKNQRILAIALCSTFTLAAIALAAFNESLYVGENTWRSLWFLTKLGLSVGSLACGLWAYTLLDAEKVRVSHLILALLSCIIFGFASYLYSVASGYAVWQALFVVACAVCAIIFVARFPIEKSNASQFLIATITATLLGVSALALFLAPSFYLGDENMRILWQLIQGTFSGVALLIGCILIFKRRGGIVVIHSGIALMMLYELFVGTYAIEEQMSIQEGQTTQVANDTRFLEMAIIDKRDDDLDRVIAVPLANMGLATHFLTDARIKHDDLPFDLQIVKYYKNTRTYDNAQYLGRRLRKKEKTLANAGYGKEFTVDPRKPVTGADGATNQSSIFARFYEKDSDEEVGTYLISQTLAPETVRYDGNKFTISLRFKEVRKPYEIHLKDVRKDDYVGTNTPRNYSSDIVLRDPLRKVKINKHIKMNNPMRYAGETFYQSGYNSFGGREYTTLQIVTNTGWMAPYVGCMIVAVGLMAHFYTTLTRFLNRTRDELSSNSTDETTSTSVATNASSEESGEEEPPPVMAELAEKDPGPPPKENSWIVGWIFPVAVLLIFGGFVAKNWVPKKVPDSELQLDQFGRQPVVYEGREKPFDTLARDSLRVISDYETFVGRMSAPELDKNWDKIAARIQHRWPTVDSDELEKHKHDPDAMVALIAETTEQNPYLIEPLVEKLTTKKYPAIRWFMDVISGADVAKHHKVFRVDNLDVLQLFDLERRKGFRYSFAELKPRLKEFEEQIAEASETEMSQRTPYQAWLGKLNEKLHTFRMLQTTFALPRDDLSPYEKVDLMKEVLQLVDSSRPLSVPTGKKRSPWESLSVSVVRDWMPQVIKETGLTEQALTKKWVAAAMTDAKHKEKVDDLVDDILLDHFKDKAKEELQDDLAPSSKLEELALKELDSMSKEERQGYQERGTEAAEAFLENLMQGAISRVKESSGPAAKQQMHPVAKAQSEALVAYRAHDVAAFNKAVDEYTQAVAAIPTETLSTSKIAIEAEYNRLELFYNSAVFYVVALVLTFFGWLTWMLDWYRPFLRAAFILIAMAFFLHTTGLVLRIYISDRPPVTNLYSSAVFIGWACVGAGLIIERMFKLGFGNVLSSVAGFSTLIIAMKLALTESDTMKVLQAVLDTTFWLTTHVVCITLGYAATFLAGLLATIYISLGFATPLLTRQFKKWTIGKILANMTYGVICFAIFFSFVGTVLGGLWADDSWGRFWGWDPKENGALIIVLWNAIVLHARWGGMVRDRGFAVLAIGGNIVTSWSWFGVNELGVGLHSYGFTDGVLVALGSYVFSQMVIIGMGILPLSMWRSFRKEDSQPSAA